MSGFIFSGFPLSKLRPPGKIKFLGLHGFKTARCFFRISAALDFTGGLLDQTGTADGIGFESSLGVGTAGSADDGSVVFKSRLINIANKLGV